MAGLQFDWIEFYQTRRSVDICRYVAKLLTESKPVKLETNHTVIVTATVSPGLAVMGGDSCSKDHLVALFSLICCKKLLSCLLEKEKKEKEWVAAIV